MFKVWTEKNRDDVVRYPRVNQELDVTIHGRAILKLVDDIIYDYKSFADGELDDHAIKEINDLKLWKSGDYSFDCVDFTYYVSIK